MRMRNVLVYHNWARKKTPLGNFEARRTFFISKVIWDWTFTQYFDFCTGINGRDSEIINLIHVCRNLKSKSIKEAIFRMWNPIPDAITHDKIAKSPKLTHRMIAIDGKRLFLSWYFWVSQHYRLAEWHFQKSPFTMTLQKRELTMVCNLVYFHLSFFISLFNHDWWLSSTCKVAKTGRLISSCTWQMRAFFW